MTILCPLDVSARQSPFASATAYWRLRATPFMPPVCTFPRYPSRTKKYDLRSTRRRYPGCVVTRWWYLSAPARSNLREDTALPGHPPCLSPVPNQRFDLAILLTALHSSHLPAFRNLSSSPSSSSAPDQSHSRRLPSFYWPRGPLHAYFNLYGDPFSDLVQLARRRMPPTSTAAESPLPQRDPPNQQGHQIPPVSTACDDLLSQPRRTLPEFAS